MAGKIMRKIIAFIFLALIFTACKNSLSTPYPRTTPANPQNCYYNWSTQSLPELSAQIQTAINAAGLTGVLATAEAYGENCYDSNTNKPVSFSTLETDFHITAKVTDLTDKDSMGNLLEKILVILDTFPTGTIPGPQPGFINVSFRSGALELNISFTVTAGKSARDLGYHRAALFDELQR